MRTFISNTQSMDLSEIYQDVDAHFAFCKEKEVDNRNRIVQQHPWVKCRDFLNDALVYSVERTYSPEIYGFEYDGRNNPINLDNIEMLIRIGNDSMKSRSLRQAIKVLNKFEKENGFIPTVMKQVARDMYDGKTYKYFHVKGDKLWLTNTIYLSLFTHFIRSVYTEPKIQSIFQLVDKYMEYDGKVYEYTRAINRFGYNKLVKMFANAKDLCLHSTPCGADVDEVQDYTLTTFHDNLGFVAWMNNGGDPIVLDQNGRNCDYCDYGDCDTCEDDNEAPSIEIHADFSHMFKSL